MRLRWISRLSSPLIIIAALASPLYGPFPALANSAYATSNMGVTNIQASTAPLTLACPATAPWLRDPTVCAQRWSTTANDKSESDLAVDPTNPMHIVAMSKFFFSPKDYLFRLGWYDSP